MAEAVSIRDMMMICQKCGKKVTLDKMDNETCGDDEKIQMNECKEQKTSQPKGSGS